MIQHEGFWWAFGDFCYDCFRALEWTYETITPNKLLIVVGFVATAAWIYVQHKYNKAAAANGTLK